jgi:putative addiction module component (TIGR02574 family)
MPQTIDIEAIRKLSVEQRLKLLDAIWETLVDDDADIPVDPAVLAEMRRRGQWARENPDKLISHDEMKARLRGLM